MSIKRIRTVPTAGASLLLDVLSRHHGAERREATCALLMCPLMTATHPAFHAVRRHAHELRDWFAQTAGWVLQVDRECARLYKRPADLHDPSRGAPEFDRGRYVLFCLACAVLKRTEPQMTLRALGAKLLVLAAEPALHACGFSFTLESQHGRRDLVAVCRYLLSLGVLQRVAGDEDGFIHHAGDALYDVHRRLLAGLLAAPRGPSSWAPGTAPENLDERLSALAENFVADSEDGRRIAMRHHLARRLLDDPVLYFDDLAADAPMHAYFQTQRGVLAARLCEATGLVAEQRAEGLALVDEDGELTDVAMPSTGTVPHITLLVAEYLSSAERAAPGGSTGEDAIAAFLATARLQYGSRWNKTARQPGAEAELVQQALARLASLRLVLRADASVRVLPALMRFSVGEILLTAGRLKSHQVAGEAQAGLFT